MTKGFYKGFVFVASILLLATCDNHEFPKSPYPRIETLPVANISESGVTFQATITQHGDLPIIDHGFVWGITENILFNNESTVQFGATSDLGNFEAHVSSGLYEGETYFVKAFVKTADYFVYGDAVSFTSKGSTPPVVSTFFPTEATSSDTVIIKGSYFSSLARNNLVKFGDIASTVLNSTDSTILCVVPNLQAGQNYVVSVEVSGNKVIAGTQFHLLTPEINLISPNYGIFGDTVIIYGRNFTRKKDYTQLTIDGLAYQLLNLQKDQLSFILPSTLNKSLNRILVKMSGVNLDAGEFKVNAPIVEEITGTLISTYNNAPLVIKGHNFNPIVSKNKVKIGGYPCKVLSSTLLELTIESPKEIIPDLELTVKDTFNIEIAVLDQSISIDKKIVVSYLSRWTKMKDFPGNPRVEGASFAINGRGYIGLGSGEEFENWYNDLWEYNPVTDAWRRLRNFPGLARSKFVTLVTSSKVYIIGGIVGHNSSGLSNDLSEVWEYNPDTDHWTRKNDFPGGTRAGSFGFVINNNGYFGGGNNSTVGPRSDFWRYNTDTDSWTQLNNTPGSQGVFAISDGIDGYIVTDSFWKYNKVNDSWVKISNNPVPYRQTAGFSLNGKFYVGTGIASNWPGTTAFFEYNIGTNNWSEMVFRGKPRRMASAFSVSNYGYLLLGQGECHCADLKDVWRFDPSKP